MSIFNKRRNRFLRKGISTLSAVSCIVCQSQSAFAFDYSTVEENGIYKLTDVLNEKKGPSYKCKIRNSKDNTLYDIEMTDKCALIQIKNDSQNNDSQNNVTEYYFLPLFTFSHLENMGIKERIGVTTYDKLDSISHYQDNNVPPYEDVEWYAIEGETLIQNYSNDPRSFYKDNVMTYRPKNLSKNMYDCCYVVTVNNDNTVTNIRKPIYVRNREKQILKLISKWMILSTPSLCLPFVLG